jgi:signal transduction histidine kinase
MIEQIYLSLILTGATIGAVLLYLWRQAGSASHISLALIRLNEQHNFDLPDFLRSAWPLLSRAGLRGTSWRLDWFGAVIEEQAGLDGGHSVSRELEVGEMKLAINLFLSRKRGERRYFDESVVETFLLLLRTDMWIKAGATDATFTQMSRLSLFLQHDMKNIAQFIQLMGDQLAAIAPGKEQQTLDYLRLAVPLIRQRADRVVSTVTVAPAVGVPVRTVQLHQELAQLSQLYRLECVISGRAEVQVADHALVGALDNIMKNYSDHTIKPELRVAITNDGSAIGIAIAAANAPAVARVERLFEPFWSSNPNGLGIGLYQAKQGLERAGGSLEAGQTTAGLLHFHIRFPHGGLAR